MRFRLKTATAVAGLAGAAILSAALPLAGQAASRGHHHRSHTPRTHQTAPACAVVFIVGRQSCYAPSAEAEAVRGISWAVSPDAAVKSTLGLDLSQVSVNRMPTGGTSQDVHPIQIDYLYGPLQRDYGRMAASPVAVRVIENPGKAIPTTGMAPGLPMPTVVNACGSRIEISPAADPDRAHPAHGPWYAVASFPHGEHSVGVVANIDQQRLISLTCRILQAG
jgi:hypothetical protein